MRNQQNVKVRNGSSWETICPFPVGYVYMSSNSTSPANIYGGTWSPISGGRYMRAAAAWGNGGSNTITADQMPKHKHTVDYTFASWSGSGSGYTIQVTGTANGAWNASVSSEGGGATVLSNISKRLLLVQNCLAILEVYINAPQI